MKLRSAISIAAALAAVSTVAAGSASKPPGRAHDNVAYVSHSAIGTNKSCASPGFNSVQAAVDAVAANGTVYLCGATPFVEQVFLGKSVTVTGDPGASIASPTTADKFALASDTRFPSQFQSHDLFAPQAIVVVTGAATNATIKGIGVHGPLPGNGGCANREYGVLVLGGFLQLTKASVTNAQDANASLNGCQFGVGVQVGSKNWRTADWSLNLVENFTADAEIENTTITGYAKNGITIDGIGSDGDIHDNIVSGFGPTAVVAQNGIEIARGATGEVDHNSVSGNQYIGPGFASSTGVLLYGGCGDPLVANVDIHNNTAVDNDVGISMDNYNPTCDGPATTPTKNRADNNRISNGEVTNVSGFCDSTGNCPGQGYQAGVADVGNGDEIANNKISGAGYAPNATPPAAWVQPIDTTSFPTIAPNVHGNIYKP